MRQLSSLALGLAAAMLILSGCGGSGDSSGGTGGQASTEWPAEAIKLYGPGTDSGTFDYFTKEICGEEKASRADYTASEDDNQLVTGVKNDKHALAYFGYAYYEENKDTLKLLGVKTADGQCILRAGDAVQWTKPARVLSATEVIVEDTYLHRLLPDGSMDIEGRYHATK